MKAGCAPIGSSGALGVCGGRRPQCHQRPAPERERDLPVTARGDFWFEIYMERLNALRFVDLLTHFMRVRKSPVFLIVDGHPTHIVKVVAQYVQRLAGRLELHFLRGYAQELNPDEFVLWNQLKRQIAQQDPVATRQSLRSPVLSDLATIQSHPSLIRSFFPAPSVAYTRD